jgi:hypothetical protein
LIGLCPADLPGYTAYLFNNTLHAQSTLGYCWSHHSIAYEPRMGSSTKKKKEKKKDFQVRTPFDGMPENRSLKITPETQAESRKSEAEGIQLHRHELQVQVYES